MGNEIKIEKRLIESSPGSFIFEFNNEIPPQKCKEIIERFEQAKDEHYRGRVGPNFQENDSVKKSTDMVISGKESWKDIDELFFVSLSKALSKIKKEYDFFNGKFKDIGYAIQRTDPGEYFHWHIDTGSHSMSDRQLVAIWYLNDVEGPGGASNEDEFLRKIETRSPHTRIDKAVLDLKLLYSKSISYRFSLRFDDDNAYADKHYLTIKNSTTRLELGKNRPHVALKREIEGYPLIGTAYWKGREYHADIERDFNDIGLKLGTSIALKRPLGYDDAAEDKSFKMLVYDDGEKIDGQTVELGLRAKYSLGPLNLSSWYYYGKLIDDEDWKKRLHYDFDWYAEVEPDDVLNKDANIDHYWYGGRASILVSNVLFRAEYIKSLDGFLPRDGFYTEIRTKVPSLLNNNLLFFLLL